MNRRVPKRSASCTRCERNSQPPHHETGVRKELEFPPIGGRGWCGESCRAGGLEVYGAEVAEGGVAAGRAVERFDPVEHGSGEPGAGWPLVSVEQLTLQRCEEAFGDGVVEGVADGAQRAEQPGVTEPLSEHP